MNSFLYNHIKYQIASLIIMTILEIIYFYRPKLKTMSTRIFTSLMISSYIYLLFDIATVVALSYYDKCPMWLTRFTHQGFVIFLDIALISIYLYLDFTYNNQKRYTKKKLIAILTLIILSFIFAIILPLYYYVDDEKIYSYGPMATMVYTIIILFSILTVIKALKNLKHKEFRRKTIYVLWTMGLWFIFGITQIIIPYILISSVGIASMILLMFLSLENPSEYLDKETQAFNYSALKTVLFEHLSIKKPFKIVTIELEELSILENQISDTITTEIIMAINSYLEKTFRFNIYRINKSSICFLIYQKALPKTDFILSKLEKRFQENWSLSGNLMHISAHANIISCPDDFHYNSKILDIMDFIENCSSFINSTGFIRFVDEQSKEKRLRQSEIIKLTSDSIENQDIKMYYQPIYSLKDKSFTNAEALVRLNDKSPLGYVSPEEFIPLAEHNGLIMKLSNCIFEKVFSFMSKSDLKNKGVQHIEVNLSGLQSVDADLPNLMKNLLNKYSISPDTVNLEITESIAISSGYMLKKNMEELKKFGCSFSMDDFGTGYSNLSQMTKVNFEIIKIDKSLLWPCFEESNEDILKAKMLLENLISMILQIGKKIVVEGIETKEQFEYLEKLGITFAQGFYFSKPLPQDEFIKFLEEHNKQSN